MVPSNLNDNLGRWSILSKEFISLSYGIIFFWLAVSFDRDDVYHMGFPLKVSSSFDLTAFGILFLSLDFAIFSTTCLRVFLVEKSYFELEPLKPLGAFNLQLWEILHK